MPSSPAGNRMFELDEGVFPFSESPPFQTCFSKSPTGLTGVPRLLVRLKRKFGAINSHGLLNGINP